MSNNTAIMTGLALALILGIFVASEIQRNYHYQQRLIDKIDAINQKVKP